MPVVSSTRATTRPDSARPASIPGSCNSTSRARRAGCCAACIQWPHPQGKLVSVLEGEVYDVAVDIRRGSPTFGQSASVMLTAGNHRHFWVPEGFAHGFCVVSEFATFTYQCTALYDPKADAGIRWNDAALGIDWPVSDPLLSDKDRQTPLLADVPSERLPSYLP